MKEGGGGGEGRKLPFFAAFAPKQHGNACFAGYKNFIYTRGPGAY